MFSENGAAGVPGSTSVVLIRVFPAKPWSKQMVGFGYVSGICCGACFEVCFEVCLGVCLEVCCGACFVVLGS